jgi:hypothetical protein
MLAGAAMGAATSINYLCAPLALILLIAKTRGKNALLYIGGGVPFALFLAWYHWAAFGSPLRTPIATTNPAFLDRAAFLGIFYLPQLDALWGITLSPYRGLFYLAPMLLFAVVALVRAKQWTILTFTAPLLLLHASFNGWHGGYTIGPRYLLPIVPLLALRLRDAANTRARPLFFAAAVISLLFNFAATAVDPQPPDRLRDPLGKYELPALLTGSAADDASVPPWLPALYTGHTSTNRVAIDELTPFTRHAIGSRENEWASFNLGELLFGAGSFASILPWLAIVATSLAFARRRHRATRTTPDTQTARSRSA